MGRIVDCGDGDNGAGGFLSGGGCGGDSTSYDLTTIEPTLFAQGSNVIVQPIQSSFVAHKEETNSSDSQGASDIVDDIDFDKCFSELFPDLAVAEAGINL